MGRIKKTIIPLLIVCLASGCGPSYPKDKIAQCVVEVCKKEYGADVLSKVQGKTLGAYLEFDGKLFDQNLYPTQDAITMVSNVFFVLSRVALSSDADIEFFKLIAADRKNPGVEWTLVKYVDDYKRALASFISKEESDLRTEIDYNFSTSVLKNAEGKASDFKLEEVKLQDFLAKQIARRIKLEAQQDKEIAKYASITEAKGSFDKERFYFIFNSQLLEKVSKNDARDRRLVDLALEVAAKVLGMYKFKGFNVVVVVDSRNLKVAAVKREMLWTYRK